MRKTTVAMLVALFGIFAAAISVATPQVAFAQTASSSASATDLGSAASGAGANFFDGTSGAASAAGDDAESAGGDQATCPTSSADDGGCARGTR
jgi:hypothetical protein